jgi:hypothetical protein
MKTEAINLCEILGQLVERPGMATAFSAAVAFQKRFTPDKEFGHPRKSKTCIQKFSQAKTPIL